MFFRKTISKQNQPTPGMEADDLNQEVYGLKISHAVLILFFLAGIFYVLDFSFAENVPQKQPTGQPPKIVVKHWYERLPYQGFADACLSTAIIGFVFEWVVRRETKRELHSMFRKGLENERDPIISKLVEALLFKEDYLIKVLKQNRLDDVIIAALKAQYDDPVFASDVYQRMFKQVYQSPRVWHGYQHKWTLLNYDSDNSQISRKYFRAVVDLSYRTKLDRKSFVFSSVGKHELYLKRLADHNNEYTMYFEPTKELSQMSDKVFSLESFSVNEYTVSLPAPKHVANDVCYIIDDDNLTKFIGTEVEIKYRLKTFIQKKGHMLMVNLVCPTKGVEIAVDFGGTKDIAFMNVFPFLFSNAPARINFTPSLENATKTEVSVREWAFPNGGVSFVWVLRGEMTNEFDALMDKSV
jgi:hypothetical protein